MTLFEFKMVIYLLHLTYLKMNLKPKVECEKVQLFFVNFGVNNVTKYN